MDDDPIRLDARNLRGIAHPARVRILTILRAEGPATASMLARRLGLNTGATSYHLRQLAEHGFIADMPGEGVRRERWWRAAHPNTVLDDGELFADQSGVGPAFLRSLAAVWTDGMVRAIDATPGLTPAWREAQDFSDFALRLTPERLDALGAELHAVIRRYRADGGAPEDPPAPGSAPVTVQLQMFPNPDTVAGTGSAGETEAEA